MENFDLDLFTNENIAAIAHYICFNKIDTFRFVRTENRIYFYGVEYYGPKNVRFCSAVFNVHKQPVKSEYFYTTCNITFNCDSSGPCKDLSDARKKVFAAYNAKLQEIENKQ